MTLWRYFYGMNNLALEKLINEANLLLVRAEEELQKPQREMVSFAACQMAKLSMFNLLKAYLVKHKIEVAETDKQPLWMLISPKWVACRVRIVIWKNIACKQDM